MSLIRYELKKIQLVTFNPQGLKETGIKSNYMNWFSDQVVTAHNSHGLFPQTKTALDEFFKDINENKILVQAIIDRETKMHIGNVSLQRVDWINKSAEIAIVMGERDFWGKGYATIACRCMMYHGFMKLNLHRIFTGTSATNIAMQKVALKIGMKHESTFREAMFLHGEYHDIYEYGILDRKFITILNEKSDLFKKEDIF